MLHLIIGVDSISCEWITATVLSVDDHASQRADGYEEYQTGKVHPHRTKEQRIALDRVTMLPTNQRTDWPGQFAKLFDGILKLDNRTIYDFYSSL